MRSPLVLFVAAALAVGSAHAREEVRIATAGPVTGDRAWSGEQFRRGAELAVRDLNAAGGVLGRAVRLLVADDAGDADQAAAVARHLADQGVVMVAGHRSSDTSIAAAPVYGEAGIVQISPSATSPRFTDEGPLTAFRVCGRDDNQGRVAARMLAAHYPDAAIAVLHDDSVYGKGLATEVLRGLRTRGLRESLIETYASGTVDFSPLIHRLQAAGIEVIYGGGYSPDLGLLMRQAAENGYRPQLVSGDSLHNADFAMIAGDAAEGALYTFDRDPRERPEAAEVVRRLRGEGYEPEGYALHTYAAIQVWAEAVARAGTFEAAAVAAQMHAGRFHTVLGELDFDQRGDLVTHTFHWYVWGSEGPARLPDDDAR